MITIQINDPYQESIAPELFEQAAQAVFMQQEISDELDLTIVVTSSEEIQSLNEQFMGISAPTDVLSFPSSEVDPDTGRPYLGDIIISFPQAASQAQQGGHPITAEMELLAVHGILHLMGYDHAEESDRLEMWANQSEILFGLDNPLAMKA